MELPFTPTDHFGVVALGIAIVLVASLPSAIAIIPILLRTHKIDKRTERVDRQLTNHHFDEEGNEINFRVENDSRHSETMSKLDQIGNRLSLMDGRLFNVENSLTKLDSRVEDVESTQRTERKRHGHQQPRTQS